MFGRGKIRIETTLYDRAVEHASKTGYSSIDEWVAHLLEKEIRNVDEQKTKEKVLEKMKGLGYMQ